MKQILKKNGSEWMIVEQKWNRMKDYGTEWKRTDDHGTEWNRKKENGG